MINLNKKTSLIILIILIITSTVFVLADPQQSLQEELDSLIQELNTEGYEWLVNSEADVEADVSAQVEVYTLDNELIATFDNIQDEDTYKVYLTDLQTPQQTFDLKILNADVDIDWIVDPTCPQEHTDNLDGTCTAKIYSSTEDGYVYGCNSDWDTVHGLEQGSYVNSNGISSSYAMTVGYDRPFTNCENKYFIGRSFFYFDTTDSIYGTRISASLSIHTLNGAQNNIIAQKGTQADEIIGLSINDFDSFTGNEYGHIKTLENQYNTIEFNSQGLNDINAKGVTKICTREYIYDFSDLDPGVSSNYPNSAYYAESSLEKRPYLNITYAPCGDGICVPGEELTCDFDCHEVATCPAGQEHPTEGLCQAILDDPFEDNSLYDLANTQLDCQTSPPSLEMPTSNSIIFGGEYAPDPYYVKIRGYIEWDTSTIPGDITVLNTKFKYHGVTSGSNTNDGKITSIPVRPTESSMIETWEGIRTGTVILEPFNVEILPNQIVELDSSANTELQQKLSDNWFAIGLISEADECPTLANAQSYIVSEDYSSPTPPPTLEVTYALCGDNICVEGEEATCMSDCGNELIYECGQIDQPNTYYTLMQDLETTGTCLTIEADNIILDGKGYTIKGGGTDEGVYANGHSNLTIKNLSITSFYNAIKLESCSNNKITNNNASSNEYIGIYLSESSNNNITNNNANSNLLGGIFMSSDSNNNTISNNTANSILYGILVHSSSNNIISNNNASSSSYSGIYLYENSNNNTIASNIIVGNLNSDYGIRLSTSSNNIITNNTANSNKKDGIYLETSSSNNIITNNNASSNERYGVFLSFNSNNNKIIDNNVNSNTQIGVLIQNSKNNIITNTEANLNSVGIYLTTGAHNNTIINSTLNRNTEGINIASSINNSIINTTITYSTSKAIYLLGSGTRNTIFQNVTITGTSNDIQYQEGDNINETYLIDTPIEQYNFGTAGGTLIIKKTNIGEIRFLNSINGSGVNLSDDIQLHNNLAAVKSDIKPGLNKSANITLYNLTHNPFTNPKILKDNQPCTDCYNFTDLNLATVIFNVSGFTNYSIGESPSKLISGCPYTLNQPNTHYYLTDDIEATGTCLTITADNITLDGQGHSIKRTGKPLISDIGISAENRFNITAKNLNITGFGRGIQFKYTQHSLLKNLIIDSNIGAGIVFTVSSNNSLINITSSSNRHGIYFGSCENNHLVNFTISSNQQKGLYLVSGGENSSFSNGVIDYSGQDAIYIQGNNLQFTNITVRNTNLSYYDLKIVWESDEIRLIDSYIENYSFYSYGNIISFKKTNVGEIKFLQPISGSGSNLSDDIQLHNNLTIVKSNMNPGLNKPANITLYNLIHDPFTNPAILKNNLPCQNCYNFTDLNAQTVIFNITSWTNYSIGENKYPPYAILHSPANESTFEEGAKNITLNATILDQDSNLIETLIYGINAPLTIPHKFYNSLLYKQNVQVGTNIIYNFTTLPVDPNSPGLELLIHFDNRSEYEENQTIVKDFSLNSLTGTRSGNLAKAYTTDSKFGYAGIFNSTTDDYISFGSNTNLLMNTQTATISLWINSPLDSTENQVLVDVGVGPGEVGGSRATIEITNDNKILVGGRSADDEANMQSVTTTTSPLQSNTWHLITGVINYEEEEIEIYVDGNKQATMGAIDFQQATTSNTPPQQVTIGVDSNPNDGFYTGKIDEIAIWNTAFSSQEIKNLYRLEEGKYFWKISMTDSYGLNSESEIWEFNITAPVQSPPVIENIEIASIQEISAGGENPITFNITVTDPQGFADISNLNATFKKGTVERHTPSCSRIETESSGNEANFSCTVGIWYWDEPLVEWTVSAKANDTANLLSEDTYTQGTFTIQPYEECRLSTASLTWLSSLTPGEIDKLATEGGGSSLIINNTGNTQVAEIKIKALNLLIDEIQPYNISANKFTIKNTDACEGTVMIHNQMSEAIDGSSILPGNNSKNTNNDNSGQEQLFACLEEVPIGLPAATYSTTPYIDMEWEFPNWELTCWY